MKRKDLMPFKAVVEEVGTSRANFWRAAQCDTPGFPKPIIIRRLVYWKKSDLSALEDALFQYKGRIAFERQRDASRKIAALTRAKAAAKPKRQKPDAPTPQRGFFD